MKSTWVEGSATPEAALVPQTVTVGNLSFTYGGAAKALTVTAPGSGTKHYSSDNESVATVDASGNVTPHAVGTATITVTVDADGTYAEGSGTGTVTVNAVVPTVTTPTSASVGTTSATLGATVTGNGGVALTGGGVVYSSSATTPTVGGSGCTSAALASAPTVNTPFTKAVSSLTPGTKYYYRGWAQNGSASGYGYSTVGNFTTKCLAPSAASGLTATGISNQRIDLSWTAATANSGSGGSVKYLVLRTDSASAAAFTPTDGTAYSTGATVGEGSAWTVVVGAATSTTKSDTGLAADTVYRYAVYAYQEAGTDAATIAYAAGATASATTQSAIPTAWTSGVTCDSTGGKRATLSWTANTGANGCAGYMVVIKQGSSAPANDVFTQGEIYTVDEAIGSAGAIVKYVGPNNSSVTISGLNGNTTYTAKVFAYNGNNYRAYRTGSSSVTFTTESVTGPKVWVTGVDTNAFLVNWAATANTGGYLVEVEDGSGNTAGPWANSFTGDEGWEASTSDATGYLTVGTEVGAEPDKWYLNTVRRYPTTTETVQGETEYGYLYLTAGGSFVDTPVLPGDVTEVRVKWRNGGGNRTLRLDVAKADSTAAAATTGVTSWTTTGSGNTAISVYNTATISTKGKRLRFYNNSGSGNTLYLHHIALTMKGVEGHSAQVNGLSDGTAYTALVSALPDGEPGEATATTGVVPGAPTASELRNKVTFTWAAAAGASGYRVDATLTNVAATGASWTTKTPPNSTLSFVNAANWGGKEWCYTNTANAQSTASQGSAVTTVPAYDSSYGHVLTGVAGTTLMSTNYPIGGATNIVLSFTVRGFNLNASYGGVESGRVNAYYKLDDGPWCYLGTAIPTGTGTGNPSDFKASVPQGALDGTNIAFKITAINAERGGGYNRGPTLLSVTVTRQMPSTTADHGYYGTNSLSGYPQVVNGTSHTVTVGGSGTSVYFRVQALQGSTSDPTARSIWKAAKGTTTAYTAPGTPSGSSITRNSMTVTWTAGNTTDLSKYVLEVSTSSSFPGGSTTSYDVTGATRKDLSGLTAGTTYYFRVKAVGTDSQESAWSGTGNATTLAFNGPVLTGVTGEGRNKFTVNWTAVAGSSKYVIQWTKCAAGGGEDTLVSTCPDGTTSNRTLLATSPQAGAWSWQRPAGELWPEWDNGYGNFTSGNFGHNLMSSVSYGGALSPKPALVSPVLDLSGYTGGYVSFSLASRHSGYRDPYSQVTLYYSTDGGTSWTKAGTSASGAASYAWTANQTLEIPTEATGAGKTNVRLKLQADSATTKYSGGNVFTGPMLKLVKVYGTGSTGDYSGSCSSASAEVDVTGGATSYTIEGLDSSSTYYFRVLSVASSDGVRSSWSEGSGATTEFAGPTGLEITEAGRYTLSAAWDAYGEEGYTTTYNVQLTPCASAGATAETVATCPASKLDWGESASAWTYQREYSGSTASGYPQYSNGVHRLWGQYSSTSIQPGIISPEMDLSGFASASVEFSHMYVNKEEWSEVVVSYKLSGGDWVDVATTATATGSTLSSANARSVALPAAALVGGVKIRVATLQAKNYNNMTLCAGASIANLKVTARGAGGGDYSGGCSGVQTFNGISSASKAISSLSPEQDYYIRVQTVMTKDGVSATSSWSEIPATTAVAQPPPEEVWAEGVRQNHMTVAWSEAPGATGSTLYKYEVSSCSGATSTEVAAAETRTDGDLEEGVDDWSYVGGGTAPESTQQTRYGFLMETYPAWARLSENTIVLAGAGEPGIESIEFSTVGASAGSITFLHGRWYDGDDLSYAKVTASYSIDGGDSWTDIGETAYDDLPSDGTATKPRSFALPAGALGHAHVKLRLEARSAADSGAGTTKPIGAAIQKAKVTLTKQGGDYSGSGCSVSSGTGLTAEQLSAELEGLEAGHAYYFRVAASDGVLVGGAPQYGAWTESMATTKSAPTAPASAWVVPESIGRHAMTVQWDAVADAETYVVKVYFHETGALVQTLETDATTLTVTGLTAEKQYDYTIQSKADGESSSGTANTSATTSAALNITGFCVTNILDESLSVKWDAVAATTYTLEVGPMTTNGSTGALYETIECPATTLARSDKGNGWFYLGGNANYPKYYVKSSGTAAQKAEDQGHVLSYSSAGTPGIQSRWFSTFGTKSATIEFLHGRWFNGGANSALQVFYSIDGGTTWTLAGDIASTANEVPGSAAAGGAKTVTRFALPERALGQRTVAIRLLAPNAASGGSYGYGAEIKDLTIKLEAYPEAASTFSGSVSGGVKNLSGLAAGQRYWFRLTATETGAPDSATAIQTAATRQKTTGVVQSQGFEGPSGNGALDTTAWGYSIKYIPVQNGSAAAHTTRVSGDPEVVVVDGENPMYGDRALRMSGSAAAGTYGVVEFANKDFGAGHAENVAVTIPFAACDLAEGENLWVTYSVNGGSTWVAPEGLATLAKSGMTLGKIGRGGSDAPNQNWPYNRGMNETTRPAGDAYTFEVSGVRQIAVRVAFCGNSGSAKHYYYLDEVKLERLATPPSPVSALANSEGSVDLGWTPAGGQSVVIIRGQDQRTPPASVDLNSLPQGYEALKDGTNFYWVNTADPGVARTNLDTGVTGGWKYFYYFYGALANGDGTYTLSKECVAREVIVKGMVEAIASQGWDGWDVHPWGYRKGRTTNPGRAGDCGYWAYNQSGDTLPYEWAHFVENSWEYDGDARGAQGANTYAYYYGAGKTYGPAGRTDPDCTNQLGVSSYTNYFGTNCFRLSGGSGWTWSGPHTWTNNSGNVRTETDPTINTNNAAIQFDTIDLSGYKNVQFSFHYAQTYSGGGNYMHVAISTNGNGENGSWMAYDNKNDGGWRQVDASRDYGLQLQTMTSEQTGGNVDFYDESRAPYGNPFVLNVPDAVTQMTVRLTFFDTTGHDQRKALVFVDEVRLTGEVAIEKPKPYISEIGKDRFMVHWEAVPDATSYDVQVTEYCDESKIKLSQAFAVKALPKDWTKSDSGVTFTKSASRLYSGASGDHDFGLNLSGASGVLTSPEVGGTTNLQFFAKALRIGTGTHLIVEAKGDKDTAWEQIGDWTATQLTTGWKGYTNSLPNRQWTQVRFRRTGGDGTSDSIYVDDIEFHGEGIYTGTVAYQTSGISATNQLATGLTSGKRYLAHVRAVGAPAGVVVRSAWGETADWTAGDFAVTSDGFEMTRSTWASPGSGIAVIAVNDGKAFSEVPAPTGAPAVGSAVGEGVVIAQTTSPQSGAGLEHVVPYGARTDVRDQKYVVYWKRGSYWEGRLETNAVLGIYRATAADAIAITNSASVATYSVAEGKGWAGGWNVWDSASVSVTRTAGTTESGVTYYGLIGSNRLYGAGGNMLRFAMGTDTQVSSRGWRVMRELASPIDSGNVWVMATLKSANGPGAGDGTQSQFGVQLLSGTTSDKAFISYGKLAHMYDSHPCFSACTSLDSGNFPGSERNIWGKNRDNSRPYEFGNGSIYTIVATYEVGTKNFKAKVFYGQTFETTMAEPTDWDISTSSSTTEMNQNLPKLQSVVLFGRGKNGNLDFDEVRVASSWGELIGREPVAPFPVDTATATMDGKEMIRLAWTKPTSRTDTTVVPNVVRPAAEQVIVLEKNVNSEFTADQLAWKTHTAGESSLIGDAVVRVVYRGTGTEVEHVVLPGTSHRYAFYSYAEGVYAASALEVSTDSVTSGPLTMDKYGDTEYVNPFSYTNSFEVSGSGTDTEWRGGNGFTNAGGSTVHFWATGDGNNGTTANAGTWTPVKPSAVGPAYMTTEVPNYKASAGNVMKVTPAANTAATLGRTLAEDWGGQAGKTFYIAWRMSYQYPGQKKWVGLKLIDESGSHRGLFIGKTGKDSASQNKLLGIDPNYGQDRIGIGNYELNGTDGAGNGDNAYLIVAKLLWTGDSTVNVWAKAIYSNGSIDFPEREGSDDFWNATWGGVTFSKVHMIELEAGGTGADVTPGDTYFDEIRFGGSWDDLLGPKVPKDVWMLGESPSAAAYPFLGDYVTNNVWSQPTGPGQSAKHLLSESQTPAAADWTAKGVDTAWLRNENTTNTVWIATNQFTRSTTPAADFTVYAHGSATGDGTTVYSKDTRAGAGKRWNTYTVHKLPAPTLYVTNRESFKVPMGWDRGSDGGRTFEEVMVVRFKDTASKNLASLQPQQGKAYYAGDVIRYDENRYMTVVYRGTAQYYTNRPCSEATWYAAYTVNNSHYSARSTEQQATPSTEGGDIDIDGDPTDWVGTPSEPWNSAAFSQGELIWTDKLGDERRDKPACTSADITEFRVKADSTNVYFLLQLNGGTATMPTNTHIAVGLDTRLSTASEQMNWLADESYTFLGGAYYTNSPSFHYPEVQMAIHWVGGEDDDEWKVELYTKDGVSWRAPFWWKASSLLNGDGMPIASATPCVEWVVPRSELGLDGVEGAAAVTGRFSVATFLNSGSWNNQAVGVVRIESNSCAAVDALAIAPYGANDKDYALSAWDEGLKNNNVDFWMDARFGATALLADTVPSTPANPAPANDGTGQGNPILQWDRSTDAEGFVTGWLLEVSDTPNFGGVGGHTENGSVLYRVNIEMTPTLAAALADSPSRQISYKPITNCKEFWWRVRARDNAGQLSAGTIQHYTVTGKADNDGPVATLKYVGTRVGDFLTDSAYRAEVERNGEAYSILDSEFGGNTSFGFVLEWYDINGVYATNHMRAWVNEYDGTKETGPSAWPPWNPGVGDYAWNVLSTNSEGIMWGRVSPNWDLMMVNTNRTKANPPSPLTIVVTNGAGEKLSLTWIHQGAPDDAETELLLPDEMGEYQPSQGWVIQWGYDAPFKGVDEREGKEVSGNGETLKSYDEGGARISCNGVQYLTNFVNGVFGLPEYDPDVDLYLTVSAEDCCYATAWDENNPDEPWPPSLVRDDQRSWRGLSADEYDRSSENYNRLMCGWCADAPNLAHNVTVNQLIKIHVKDNDVVPPIASAERWSAGTDEAGTAYKPSLVISTNSIGSSSGNTAWANITGKLPRREGLQRDTMYQLTDEIVSSARPLSFFFNVYDDYIESGTQRGTSETTRNAADTRNLTNSAFKVKTWNPAANSGAGAWVDSAPELVSGTWTHVSENTANFDAAGSYVTEMTYSSGRWSETQSAEAKGTGPNTVLRWNFAPTAAKYEEFLNAFFGMEDVLGYIGSHSDGVTNVVQLHAWDSDDNRANDQADAEITFGRLMFSDDDATPPESQNATFFGSGTNFIRFGDMVTNVFPAKNATNWYVCMDGMEASGVSAWTRDSGGAFVQTNYYADSAYRLGRVGGNVQERDGEEVTEDGTEKKVPKGPYFQWDVVGQNGVEWVCDSLRFVQHVSQTGPTNLALRWMSATGVESKRPVTADGDLDSAWTTNGACILETVGGFARFRMASTNSTSGLLTSPDMVTSGKATAYATFYVGAYGDAGPEASTEQVLEVKVYKVSGVSETEQTSLRVTRHLYDFTTTAAADSYRSLEPVQITLPKDGTYRVKWSVDNVNGSKGFVLRDILMRTETDFSNEQTLAKVVVPKDQDENGGDQATQATVTMHWEGEQVGGDTTKRFRLYATGGGAAGTWGLKELTMIGISSSPRGHEVTDDDIRTGGWTNELEVVDGPLSGYDTVRSGLWVASNSTDNCYAWTPTYELHYPTLYKSGGVVTNGQYNFNGITRGSFSVLPDGGFTEDPSLWTPANGAALFEHSSPRAGTLVLQLPENGSKSYATQLMALNRADLKGEADTGATINGTLSLRAKSNHEGNDNRIELTIELLDGSGAGANVLDSRTYALEATLMGTWREVKLLTWPTEATGATHARVKISQADDDGAEVYVDGVHIDFALWGQPKETAPGPEDNGKEGAKLQLQTKQLSNPDLDLKLTSELSGPLADTEYRLVSTIYDYDHDRANDARGVDFLNRFALFDDDEQAPGFGTLFGGPLGVRVDDGGNVPYISSGKTVQPTVTDDDLAKARGGARGAAAKMFLDIDGFDYSGWWTVGMTMTYDGTDTTIYGTNSGTTYMLGTDSTNWLNGAAGEPRATNTLAAPVSAWWNLASVQTEFAKQTRTERNSTTSAATNLMMHSLRAALQDWDADRADDRMEVTDAVGQIRFMDNDITKPDWKNKVGNYTNQVFIGTNILSTIAPSKDDTTWKNNWKKAQLPMLAWSDADITAVKYRVYDGELTNSAHQFYIMGFIGDPASDTTKGATPSGIQRGAEATNEVASVFDSSVKIGYTNTTVLLYGDPTLDAATVVTNLAGHYQPGYSATLANTRNKQGGHGSTWGWTAGLGTNEVGTLLADGYATTNLVIKFDVWDADTNRPNDQLRTVLTGPQLVVRDDDTNPPGQPGEVTLSGGAPYNPAEALSRNNAPWTNKLTGMTMTFAKAVDSLGTTEDANGLADLEASGIAEYRLAGPDEDTSIGAGELVQAVTGDEPASYTKPVPQLTEEQQGYGSYKLFAVDSDRDRPGDALAGSHRPVPLAFDVTPPTKIGYVYGGSPRRVTANPDNTDDPTTQFDISWPTNGIGPDDTATSAYTKIPGDFKNGVDSLSPWQSYKVYYTNYDESMIDAGDNPDSEETSWVFKTFIKTTGTAEPEYKLWKSVMKGSTAQDPTAPKESGTGRSTAYDSLGAVTANVGTTNQMFRLYDLDFDQHYIVIVVGVDQAGNEGPAGLYSWATNNTIKFAITQGVVKATSAINAAIGVESGTNTVGMAPITGDNAPAKAAVLRWMAAGMKDGVGEVKKYYDLIYRDASSFNELGTEVWHMAGEDGGNSGTSKTNWNYQADAGLSTPGRLRFYRASYTGRWQDKKPGTEEYQYPLASEEVYSMNNIVLSEGFNYVSLQGVPYTNTFAAVFGTDTDLWPSGGVSPIATNGAVVVQFYKPGKTAEPDDWYFFSQGNWYSSAGGSPITDVVQSNGFFARPFSISLPFSNPDTDTSWWNAHTNYAGATYGASRQVKAMMWHPILQVPTNSPTASGYSQPVKGTKGFYNLLSLNLPVAVHPSQLGLTGGVANDDPSLADQLYVVDSTTKQVRGSSTMYRKANGEWRFVRTGGAVPYGFIRPNDMLVLISAGGSDWTWTYKPEDFYELPDRHMGRELETETPSSEGGGEP